MENRHAIRLSTTIHTSAQSYNRKHTRGETVASISQRYKQHLSSSRTTHTHMPVQTGMIELVRRSNFDLAGVIVCNRCLKQTAMSLNSCAAALYAASACGEELLGLAELFKEIPYKFSVRLEVDFDSARQALQRRGPGGLEISCSAIQQWIREERLSFGRVETKSNTAHLVTIFLVGPRTQSLSKKRWLHITGSTDD